MSVSPLASMDYSRYFVLLREGLPVPAVFLVRDIVGNTLAESTGEGTAAADACGSACLNCPKTTAPVDRTLQVGQGADRICYSAPIYSSADEFTGTLSVVITSELASVAGLSVCQIERLLGSIVNLIEKELRLTVELDAMARELAGRYEELNLVYENSKDEADSDVDSETHNRLVADYVDYLGVDMVAIVFPGENKIFCATGKEDPIDEPYEMVRLVAEKYLPVAMEGDGFLLINDFNDRSALKLGLDIPYKVAATPVLNNRGEVEGMLICVNHLYRADFYNSDKNLLAVMAKKVAKVLHANYDALTGLYNQSIFDRVLARALETASGQGQFHCLLNIDLGNVRVINDAHGRSAGDAAIRHVARLVKSKLRNTDTVAYLGEGHYGVLLERCEVNKGQQVAENLRNLVADNPLVIDDMRIDLDISLGLALIEPHSDSLDSVVEAAEIARQSAKQLGHGQIQLFRQNDSGLMDHKQRLQWVSRIRQAMRDNCFRVYCQTIAPVRQTSEQYHFEILLRLLDDDGDVVSPAEFLPPAEQFNLMPMLDRWVIDSTFSILSEAAYCQTPGEGMVSINLSGQSLSDWELPDYIARKLDEYDISPESTCFEITETVAFRDSEQAVQCMHAIKALGCCLSLDDFGTGLSSFTYLKDLPVDFLKIDGSFVRNILSDKVSHAMVASVNQIGHVMGLKTVAEFVENEPLIERLTEMEVDYLQGYAIARPVPLDEYLDELDANVPLSSGKAS